MHSAIKMDTVEKAEKHIRPVRTMSGSACSWRKGGDKSGGKRTGGEPVKSDTDRRKESKTLLHKEYCKCSIFMTL